MCDHDGTSHGELRSNGERNKLVAAIICGDCGAEVTKLGTLDYEPEPVKEIAHDESA